MRKNHWPRGSGPNQSGRYPRTARPQRFTWRNLDDGQSRGGLGPPCAGPGRRESAGLLHRHRARRRAARCGPAARTWRLRRGLDQRGHRQGRVHSPGRAAGRHRTPRGRHLCGQHLGAATADGARRGGLSRTGVSGPIRSRSRGRLSAAGRERAARVR